MLDVIVCKLINPCCINIFTTSRDKNEVPGRDHCFWLDICLSSSAHWNGSSQVTIVSVLNEYRIINNILLKIHNCLNFMFCRKWYTKYLEKRQGKIMIRNNDVTFVNVMLNVIRKK